MSDNKENKGNKKILIWGGIGVAVIIAILALVFFLQGGKEKPIKIGAILSITGAGSYSGEEVRDGVLLAIDEINSWGGINGRKLKLIIEDSKTNPQEGKKAFHKLESEHDPVIYVSTLSSVSMALTPLAEANEVPLVGLVVSTPELTKQKEWIFRYYNMAENEIRPILTILEELKVKELGILYFNDEYGKSVFESLKEEFEKVGGVVKSVSFESDEDSFKEQIEKLGGQEAIYIIAFSSHFPTIFKQLKNETFEGHILAVSPSTFPGVRNTPQANGTYVAAPIIYDPDFLFAKEVKDKYEKRYGKPFNHYAADGYDFIKLMAGLLEDEKINRENIKSLLEEGFVYSGIFGTIDLKAGEHDITIPLQLAQIVDGELEYWW